MFIRRTSPTITPNRCYRFGVLFRPFVYRSFWSCDWADTLFTKFWFVCQLMRDLAICVALKHWHQFQIVVKSNIKCFNVSISE